MPSKKYRAQFGSSNIGKARRYWRLIKFGFRLSKIPLLGRIIKNFIGVEHSNGSCIPINKSLILPDNVILPFAITEHFIHSASHIFIMNYCGCRKREGCKDYDHSIGCLWLGDAASKIDVPPEIGHLATKEEALELERRAYEAGLVPTIGRLKADSWLMGVLPDEGHFMSLCHCCPCCCVLGKLRYGAASLSNVLQRMEGVTVKVNPELCVGCGACMEVCIFRDALKIVDGKAQINQDNCKGCGRCARKCPREAITITIDDYDSLNAAIDRISSYVDVT
jgi:NAD-dependent dihydropyrimidine dehydrogenase PreA subunit